MGSNPSRPSESTSRASSESFNEKRSQEALAASLKSLSLAQPTSATGALSLDNVNSWEEEVSADPRTHLARTILTHTNIRSALSSRTAKIADSYVFNHTLDFKTGPVTNQRSSGRCWIFATTNVFRYAIMKKLNLNDFQLSQSYLFFWDKLNKSNYFLELAIETADLPVNDRLISHISGDLVSDGGQWDMSVNLIERYGLVPQSIYPEATHSSFTSQLNSILKTKLREHALILRKNADSLRKDSAFSEEAVLKILRKKKEELMKDIYSILTATLSVPPKPDEKFVWEYIDKDGKTGRWEGTPLEYYNQFASKPYKPSDSFSLIHDPRNPYNKLYTVDKLGNVWGGRPVLYVNAEIEVLKETVVKMIKAGQPVFFGCDVGQFSDSPSGVMDPALYEYETAFNITLGLTKAERLQINESAMTHAMVISGVHIDPATNKPVRYKVENSWGDAVGDHGHFVMTDRWFEEFVFQIVVPKPLAPKHLVEVFEANEPVVFPPWDPLGTLA